MQLHQWITLVPTLLLGLPFLQAKPFVHAPHSFPEYNKRFTENALTPITVPGKIFHVSIEKGSDANDGSTEKPFKTLQAARDAIRAYKKTHGLPKGGIEVSIAPGHYRSNQTFQLEQQDSGTKENPIVWKGHHHDKVIFSGGISLNAQKFTPVKPSSETITRLHPKARHKVMVLDIAHLNLKRVFGKKKNHGQLTMDGHFLPLAKWPNRGYHHIGQIKDKGPSTRWLKPGAKPPTYSYEKPSGAKFVFKETLPPPIAIEFNRTRDMQIEGYPHNDWYFQRESIGKIEGETVQLLRHTLYGVADQIKGMARRVRIVNVLAALDEPGEWYIDRQQKKLYVWPIKGFRPSKSSVVIPSGAPLLSMQDTTYVTFRGATFENTGNLAISINGGHHNLIADSIIRNGARHGIRIEGGKYNGITGCELYGLRTAFSLYGGNFKTLERCYNFATNNHIHSCRRRGYGMIGMNGVGFYFAHNLLRDMNGAVSFNTVDLLMEYNEYYNIGYEMGDFNVAYCGAKWHTMNNVLRYNFVHHLFEPGGHPISPFRNDDGGAGLKIYGNVFYRAGRCAGQFHGPANDLQNNISLKMHTFWWTIKQPIDKAGIDQAWKNLSRFGRDLPRGSKGDYYYNLERTIGEKGWLKSPWKDEFPEVTKFIDSNPWAQTLCNVNTNYAYGARKPFHIHGGSGSVLGMEIKKSGRIKDLPLSGHFELPKTIDLKAFVDVTQLDFRFKKGFKPMLNFKLIPFNRIGLHRSPYRTHVPSKTKYRSHIYNKFKEDRAVRYNPEVVNARYPKPTYLQ